MKKNDVFKLYDLRVSVVGKKKNFVCSHAAGTGFDVVGENVVFKRSQIFSLYALSALLPLLPAKQRRTHGNDWMTTDTDIDCPDPHCGARFRITRKKMRSFRHSDVTRVPLKKKEV